jgi:hypothetical protein
MNDPLATYLHDHLTGSHFAIQLLDSVHEQYKNEELGDFAAALSAEVKKDQETLEGIIQQVGKSHFDLAEATGWLAEKASKFKLQRDDGGAGLGTFEALETLTLGIKGKLALWQVLPRIRAIDPRVPDHDFEKLAARAEEQYSQVEAHRLQLARATFSSSNMGS